MGEKTWANHPRDSNLDRAGVEDSKIYLKWEANHLSVQGITC